MATRFREKEYPMQITYALDPESGVMLIEEMNLAGYHIADESKLFDEIAQFLRVFNLAPGQIEFNFKKGGKA